jgi:hypothetical protein
MFRKDFTPERLRRPFVLKNAGKSLVEIFTAGKALKLMRFKCQGSGSVAKRFMPYGP